MAAGSAVHDAGLPAPRVDGLEQVDGRTGIVMQRVDGPPMLDGLLARPWRLWRAPHLMADLHVTIHAARVPSLPSYRDELGRRIAHVPGLPDDHRQAALDALDALPDGEAVCHGDFHPGNILMTASGPVVIDWTGARCGHPLADVARTRLLLTVGVDPHAQPGLRLTVTDRLRGWFCRRYERRYCALTGTDPAAIDAWYLPLVAARLTEPIPEETDTVLALVAQLVAAR
jgi:aminoglycoside phosphotransferase (APT) family kinase protein